MDDVFAGFDNPDEKYFLQKGTDKEPLIHQTIAALRSQLQRAEEVIQGRNGRIVYLERQCAKADQDVKDASEDRGFAIKELAKVSAALAARDAELSLYRKAVGPVVKAERFTKTDESWAAKMCKCCDAVRACIRILGEGSPKATESVMEGGGMPDDARQL